MNFDDGRNHRTRRLGAVTDQWGHRIAAEWDPKNGAPLVRLDVHATDDCEGEEPDDDGYCRHRPATVLYLLPDQAEELAGWLIAGATASRAFFAGPPVEEASATVGEGKAL